MANCKKRGQFFKRLDKHLVRAHPQVTQQKHSALPSVPTREAAHMRYHQKEECGLCGKTLLLRPHLKKAHKVNTWDEYIQRLKKLKGKKRFQITPIVENSDVPAGGLNSLLKEITPMVATDEGKQSLNSRKLIPAAKKEDSIDSDESPPGSPLNVKVPYSEEEFLRFCVHNTNLYMVLATHQAIKSGKKDPVILLNYLSKNKLNIEYCNYIVNTNFIPKIYGYYRFARYYPYGKDKCISCTLKTCSCGKLPRSFYTFCRRPCNEAHFDCQICKNWGIRYHVCDDFFWCKTCDEAAKRCSIPIEQL